VPTELGFRYFVRHLLSEPTLLHVEQEAIRLQFREARQEVEQALRISTAVLARASHGAALATAPRSARTRFKHMELVHIHSTKVLLVLVLEEGAVKQQVLDIDAEMDQGELSRISNELNAHLQGREASTITAHAAGLSPFARQVAVLVMDAMQRLDDQGSVPIFRDGLADVLRLPEFAEGENVRKIVQVLEQPNLLEQLAEEGAERNAVQVVIAGNGRYAELRDITIILARYGTGDRISGLLGVIGPVRMWYDRSIGAVRFVSDLMSEMVEDIYGS
jgi:heat-inducible transcriptional repressor